MRHWQGICLSAVLLVSLVTLSYAQSVTPEDEYKQLIQVNENVQPLGAHPFGENISLYDGTLSFEETDISVPGNGPTIQLGRVLPPAQGSDAELNAQRAFGDWNLDIPRIETYTADQANDTGWQTANSATLRCTDFGAPPTVSPAQPGGDPWSPNQWWYGYHLLIPGESSQVLLVRGTQSVVQPTISGMSFPIVTKQNWMIGCGVTASDGGEGFQALAPDGTRYTFAHLVYQPMAAVTTALGTAPMGALAQTGIHPLVAPFNILNRRDAFMYVTQIQDRFGNTLAYHYDPGTGYLTSITASDGREVDVTYVSGTPLIQSVTVQSSNAPSRSWTYNYDTTTYPGLPTLAGVHLPDGSAWTFHLGGFQVASIATDGGDCQTNTLPILQSGGVTGSITHPSGLTATFTLTPMLHGRSHVFKSCWGGPASQGQAIYANVPDYAYQFSLTSEVLSGAGILTKTAQSQTWTYGYSPANQSWTTDTCGGTCPTTVYTDVLDPEGNDTRYTFSNRFDVTEGQLEQTDYYSGAAGGTVLRSEVNGYADPTGGPWPAVYGEDLQGHDNAQQVVELSPLNSRQILQDGDTYTWQAEAFDIYAQVTQTKRSNSIGGQATLEETTSYLNDTNLWVLGLPLQVTNVGSGEVESANTYAGNDTLLTRSRFGQPLMSYTFNAAGQLASFTDGNSHTTSLGNYKRGIPQTINYPDSTSETLVVDDLGQITRINDQAGHGTAYGYDAVGRVTSINYPGGDEVAWTPQSFTYSFVTSAERGLAANHWKRTATLGSANTVTYFDAMMRPVLSDSEIGSTVQASTLTTYDSKGQKLFSAYPSASALTFTQTPTVAGSTTTYDALGRATQVQQSSELGTLTTSTAYASGAGEQVTDPKGNATTTYYQVFDQPTYNTVQAVFAPGITQLITRDVYGNPTAITQSGPSTPQLTKNLIYDSYKRLCRTTEPESGSEVMAYDSANNLAWSAAGLSISGTGCGQEQVAATAQTTRSYDAMNRVTMIQPPAGTQSTIYGYDPVGRMTCAVTNPGTLGACNTLSGSNIWLATYNFRGMLTGESLQVGAQGPWGVGYAHDASGSLSLIHYPDGENVSYAPDALGRPTQVGAYAHSIGYFPNGQVSQFVYGNGTGYAAEQNSRQLLSNFSYGPGSTMQLSEDLVYDKNGNITTVTDLAGGPRNKSFGYDALNRLTSASAAGLWGTQSYTYDALNNLLTLTTGGQTATYSYANNLLMGISGAMTASYIYDARGNVQNKSGTLMSFDLKNQLLSIGSGSTTENFEYDAAGRRVHKSNGVDTYYFYSQAGQLMFQNGPGALNSTDFIYLGTKLIARDVANAPIVTSPTLSNNGSYTVSWTSFLGANSYNLQERVNGGAWTTIQSGASTASAMSGKAAAVYSYQVQACNASTCTAWSNIASTTVVYPPGAPATITVPATSIGTVAVSWSATATATSYTLQHRLGAGGWTNAYSGAGTSTSVSETVTGSYTYQVQACNAGGCSAFKLSNAVAVTRPPTSAPGLSVPANSPNGSYTVSWTSVATTSSYTLQESANGGGWTTVQSSSATSWGTSGRGNGSYGYRVQACNVSGCGPWSGTSTVTVLLPPGMPAAVTVANIQNYPGPTWAVNWSAVSTAASYTMRRSTVGTSTLVTVYTGATNSARDYVVPGTYQYQVQACNASGCSGWQSSEDVTVMCVETPMAAKANGLQPMTLKCN